MSSPVERIEEAFYQALHYLKEKYYYRMSSGDVLQVVNNLWDEVRPTIRGPNFVKTDKEAFTEIKGSPYSASLPFVQAGNFSVKVEW